MTRRLEDGAGGVRVQAARADLGLQPGRGVRARQGGPVGQDKMNWLNRIVVRCDCNRPTLDTIRQAGFAVTTVENTVLPKAPPFVSPAVIGSATTPA